MRPEPEARQSDIGETIGETFKQKYGHNVARPVAKKRPKFFARPGQIFKDSLLRADFEPGRSGHFLANGLATKRPNFNSTFSNFQFIIFKYGLKLGPHSGHESWPPPCLGGAPWSHSLGEHFGQWLGGFSVELWEGACRTCSAIFGQ